MLSTRPCCKATNVLLQARSDRASSHRLAGSRTHIRTCAVGKEQEQGTTAEQQLSALRQSLLQEYAQQLNSNSKPPSPSGSNRVNTKAKVSTQQYAPVETTSPDSQAPSSPRDTPGQIFHQAMNNIRGTPASALPESPATLLDPVPPAPKTKKTKKISSAEQQAQWIAAINSHSSQSSINNLPAANSYALRIPKTPPPTPSPASLNDNPASPSSEATATTAAPTSATASAANTSPHPPASTPTSTTATTSKSPTTASPSTPKAAASSTGSTSSMSKYAWINPRRRELLRLELEADLIPLAKHYGLDVFKTKVDVIDNLLRKEFVSFLKEREAALLKLPSREKLVPLAISYGINPSGFKREVVAAIISQEFRRLTSSRREELNMLEAAELVAYTQGSGINLYGDKGLLVGRILVHEAKLRAEFCSQLSGQC